MKLVGCQSTPLIVHQFGKEGHCYQMVLIWLAEY